MAQVTIKLNEETANKLREQAQRNFRTMSGQVEFLMDNIPVEKKSDLATPKEIKETGGLKPVRTRFTILKEIADLKLAREGELEYCQDPDTADGINAMYDVKTADLQAEYDALV